MAKPKIGGPSLVEFGWLKNQFDQLRKDHAMILTKIEQLQSVVTPELEQQIKIAGKAAHKIDQKVPD